MLDSFSRIHSRVTMIPNKLSDFISFVFIVLQVQRNWRRLQARALCAAYLRRLRGSLSRLIGHDMRDEIRRRRKEGEQPERKKVNDSGEEAVTGAMFSTPALPVSAVDGQSERVARSRLNGHFIQIERP